MVVVVLSGMILVQPRSELIGVMDERGDQRYRAVVEAHSLKYLHLRSLFFLKSSGDIGLSVLVCADWVHCVDELVLEANECGHGTSRCGRRITNKEVPVRVRSPHGLPPVPLISKGYPM